MGIAELVICRRRQSARRQRYRHTRSREPLVTALVPALFVVSWRPYRHRPLGIHAIIVCDCGDSKCQSMVAY